MSASVWANPSPNCFMGEKGRSWVRIFFKLILSHHHSAKVPILYHKLWIFFTKYIYPCCTLYSVKLRDFNLHHYPRFTISVSMTVHHPQQVKIFFLHLQIINYLWNQDWLIWEMLSELLFRSFWFYWGHCRNPGVYRSPFRNLAAVWKPPSGSFHRNPLHCSDSALRFELSLGRL